MTIKAVRQYGDYMVHLSDMLNLFWDNHTISTTLCGRKIAEKIGDNWTFYHWGFALEEEPMCPDCRGAKLMLELGE